MKIGVVITRTLYGGAKEGQNKPRAIFVHDDVTAVYICEASINANGRKQLGHSFLVRTAASSGFIYTSNVNENILHTVLQPSRS